MFASGIQGDPHQQKKDFCVAAYLKRHAFSCEGDYLWKPGRDFALLEPQPRPCCITQLFCAFSKSRKRVGVVVAMVLPTLLSHFAYWHLIPERLLAGDHCAFLTYVIMESVRWTLNCQAVCKELAISQPLIDLPMNFQSWLDSGSCGSALAWVKLIYSCWDCGLVVCG